MDPEFEREEKQNYLQENIIEKNYDTADFLNYLTEIKGEIGVDIDVWSFTDLKKVYYFKYLLVFVENC